MGKISLTTKLNQIFVCLPIMLILGACAGQQPAPPPDPGRIIIEKSHEFYYFNIEYSVGYIDDHLRVVGLIDNAVNTDLYRFIVSLDVKSQKGDTLAKTSSNFFDVKEMDKATFVLDLPLLHGPCTFSFRCDYDRYDNLDETRRRGGTFDNSDWNYFDDQIDLP